MTENDIDQLWRSVAPATPEEVIMRTGFGHEEKMQFVQMFENFSQLPTPRNIEKHFQT